MPTWLLLSLIFPALLGMVNILDKLIVDRYAPSIYFYAFWIGVYELAMGAVALGVVGSVQGLESTAFQGGVLSGAIRAVSLLFLLSALKRGQVARVVPIWYLYPLMVAPMAVGFLDESLSALSWGGILLAVVGGVLVSWQGGAGRRSFGDPAALPLALAAAATFAISIALSKHFLEDDNFWRFYGPNRLGFALGMLSVICLPDVRRGALGMVRRRGFMGFVSLVEGIVTVANIVNLAAISLGPVSLVAAIGALQPALIFFYTLVLATLFTVTFGHWIIRGTLRPQLAGISAITAGVVLISLR